MKYALISVTDKSNLDVLLHGLSDAGYCVISTGGTHRTINDIIRSQALKLRLLKVEDVTSWPEMLDGRVKTLHPKILGSILYMRDNQKHLLQAEENGLIDIDIVVVNLYPFEEAMKKDASDIELIEEIDIGGPTMLISSVKNSKHVAIVTDPSDYGTIAEELKLSKTVSPETRKTLSVKAINLLADYRSMIAVELTKRFSGRESLRLSFKDGEKLGRYGENWHQEAWLFRNCGLADAEQIAGIPLGYNNYLDSYGSFASLMDIKDKPAVAIIKHTNPCGYATADDLKTALEKAWEGDDISAFGSIITFSRPLDLETAHFFDDKFVEVLIVPDISDDALAYLKEKKKNLRILRTKPDLSCDFEYRSIDGGMLKQSTDTKLHLGNVEDLTMPANEIDDNGKGRLVGVVTKKHAAKDMSGLIQFSIKAVKHLKSNAIAICYEYEKGCYMILGMGCGQPNRVNSVKLAIDKAHYNLRKKYDDAKIREILASDRIILSSDAFFPFRDSIDELAKLGIKNIVQPGGSIKDKEVIAAADENEMSMIFTGMRHFKH